MKPAGHCFGRRPSSFATNDEPVAESGAIIWSMKLPPIDQFMLGRVIEMAWEDCPPFDAIAIQFGLDEAAVIA